MYTQIAEEFGDAGYHELSESFHSYAEGGHGSGFVIRHSETGRYFLVTNRHVAERGPSVSVEFLPLEGESFTFEKLPVLYSEIDYDLTVIALDDQDVTRLNSFQPAETPPSDGDEVWSAGYPGLLGSPSWQFASGSVTNQRAEVAEILDPEITHLIQHSAEIGFGNSGGPLLARSSDDETRFEVVGINTWAVYRETGRYFAQPIDALDEVLERALEYERHIGDTDYARDLVGDRAERFASYLSEEEPNLTHSSEPLAVSYVAAEGWDSFRLQVEGAEDDGEREREYWTNQFFNYSPQAALREVAIGVFIESISADTEPRVEAEHVGIVHVQSDFVRTELAIGDDRSFILDWEVEHGNWRITSIRDADGDPWSASEVVREARPGREPRSLPARTPDRAQGELGLGTGLLTWTGDRTVYDDSGVKEGTFTPGIVRLPFGLSVQVPLSVGEAMIRPNAGLGGGIAFGLFGDDDVRPAHEAGPFGSWSVGIDLALPALPNQIFGINYSRDNFVLDEASLWQLSASFRTLFW